MNILTRTLASGAVCAIASLGLSPAPVHAAPVSPVEHFLFVIGPDDGGACPFPVQWDITTKFLNLELRNQFISGAPDDHITITNLATGATFSTAAGGVFHVRDLPAGGVLVTSTGILLMTHADLMLVGHWTSTISPDGTQSAFVGTGQSIDLCAALS